MTKLARLSAAQQSALNVLRSQSQVTFEELAGILKAFGIVEDGFDIPDITYYANPSYRHCGRFREQPWHDFSTITEAERYIALRMIQCVIDIQELEENP